MNQKLLLLSVMTSMMAFSSGKVGHLDNEELVNHFKTAIAVAKEGGDVEEISKNAAQNLQDASKQALEKKVEKVRQQLEKRKLTFQESQRERIKYLMTGSFATTIGSVIVIFSKGRMSEGLMYTALTSFVFGSLSLLYLNL